MRILTLLITLLVTSACTSVKIEAIAPDIKPKKICIKKNPKVIVPEFLDVVKDRIEYHNIETAVFDDKPSKTCRYIMSYTAFQTWDVVMYLHHAELYLNQDGNGIGSAQYHLTGKGGLALSKFKSTKTKMDPIVDQLLGYEIEKPKSTEEKYPN